MVQSASTKKQIIPFMDRLQMLNKLGFRVQFKAVKEGLKSLTTEQIYEPNKVKIINFYRFENDSDPDYNAVLYAISTASGERGTLIDSYGSSNDPLVSDFVRAVEDSHKKEY